MNTDLITVCAACRRQSCWQGVFYCEDYRTAGTIDIPATGDERAKERIAFWEKISDLEKAVENREGRLRAAQKALGALREAARAVCWFDWSNNDSDAVAAIDRLRDMLIDQMSETLTKTEAPIGRGVHPIMAAALASFAPPSSAPRTDE